MRLAILLRVRAILEQLETPTPLCLDWNSCFEVLERKVTPSCRIQQVKSGQVRSREAVLKKVLGEVRQGEQSGIRECECSGTSGINKSSRFKKERD